MYNTSYFAHTDTLGLLNKVVNEGCSENAIDSYTLDVRNLIPIGSRSGTAGYQPKYVVNNKFIKCQSKIPGMYLADWRVEILATTLAKILRINVINQSHCILNTSIGRLDGVVSNNFEANNIQFISFSEISNILDDKSLKAKYIKLTTENKINWLISTLISVGLNEIDAVEYIGDMILLDLLVCDCDRHSHNFGIFMNNSIAIKADLFDFGMTPFVLNIHKSLEETLYQAYIEPFSEDPFELAEIFKDAARHLNYPKLNSLQVLANATALRNEFVNENTYMYFLQIVKILSEN